MKTNTTKPVQNCDPWIFGKSTHASISKRNEKMSSKTFPLVLSDVCPILQESLGGSRCFVIYVDHLSKYWWEYTLEEKTKVFATIKRWFVMVECHIEEKLQILKCDNDGEYVFWDTKAVFSERDIVAVQLYHTNHIKTVLLTDWTALSVSLLAAFCNIVSFQKWSGRMLLVLLRTWGTGPRLVEFPN